MLGVWWSEWGRCRNGMGEWRRGEEKDSDVAIRGNGASFDFIFIDILGYKEYIKVFSSKCVLQTIFITVI